MSLRAVQYIHVYVFCIDNCICILHATQYAVQGDSQDDRAQSIINNIYTCTWYRCYDSNHGSISNVHPLLL